jgi:tetratricopeptide (TPR) repeat protein
MCYMKSMSRKFALFVALTLLAVVAGPIGMADAQTAVQQSQTDELDSLFAKLRDPATGSEVLRIEPKIWSLWMSQGSALENQQLAEATDAMGIRAYPKSLEKLNALIVASPNFSEAFNKRATLYYLIGRYDESLEDITKTLDLEPRHFGALSGRGMVFLKQGKNAEALRAFKEALAINPTMTGTKLSVQQLEKLLPEL